VLRAIFDTGTVAFHGEEIVADPDWPVTLAGGRPIAVYVAAMGPKALRVTGELADGTLPFIAGPRTIADFIEPTISKAAADAGRPKPQIIAAVPVLVSEDPDDIAAARELTVRQLGFYESIPSYQKVIAREGVDSVADLAAAGSAESVRRQLWAYLDAGATDVVLSPLHRSSPSESLWAAAAALG
jgi:F420-dependent oxidoreductase-like protein